MNVNAKSQLDNRVKNLVKLHEVKTCSSCGLFRHPSRCFCPGTSGDHQCCDEVRE